TRVLVKDRDIGGGSEDAVARVEQIAFAEKRGKITVEVGEVIDFVIGGGDIGAAECSADQDPPAAGDGGCAGGDDVVGRDAGEVRAVHQQEAKITRRGGGPNAASDGVAVVVGCNRQAGAEDHPPVVIELR